LKRILAWREICPELAIRSTFITGFPGETEDDFQRLLDFLQEAQLDRVGCFTYSAVEGATANAIADPVPEELKEERKARLMELQAGISAERLARKVGQTQTVLVDELAEGGAFARSYADAPEIDGLVYVQSAGEIKVGEFLKVKITDSDEHDLVAEPVRE